MKIIPITLRQANEFVVLHHRHNKAVVGAKIVIAAVKDEKIIGVAIAGRPISRYLDNGVTCEVYRVCTDGTRNSVSFLYQRVKRIAQLMGFVKVITYTLQSESGSSLKAIGAKIDKSVEHQRQWNSTNKVQRANQAVSEQLKFRWTL